MTKENKVRRDAWTPNEDKVFVQILLRSMREGESQKEAFEKISYRTGRTEAACAFRWNNDLRTLPDIAPEFERARNKGRLLKGRIGSMRTDKWESNTALRDAYIDAYKETEAEEPVRVLMKVESKALEKQAEIVNTSNFERELTKIAMEVVQLLVKKNHDYGDSIYKTYKKHGDLSMAIRIGDKAERLHVLAGGTEPKVSESIEDIYLDSAGYNLMGLYAKKRLAEEEE